MRLVASVATEVVSCCLNVTVSNSFRTVYCQTSFLRNSIPMKQFRRLLLFFIVGVLPLVGCGSGGVPMGGKVTFSDNGAPLSDGMVCFTDGTFSFIGKLGPDGKYTIGTTQDSKDGLPPGNYKVYLSLPSMPLDPGSPQAGTKKTLVDAKFTSAEMTPLSVTVDGSKKAFDFQVDRAE